MQGMAVKKEKKKSFCQRVSPVNPRLRWSGHVPCFIGMMRQQSLEISPPPLSHGNISTHPWRKSVREGWWVDEEKMKMKAGTRMMGEWKSEILIIIRREAKLGGEKWSVLHLSVEPSHTPLITASFPRVRLDAALIIFSFHLTLSRKLTSVPHMFRSVCSYPQTHTHRDVFTFVPLQTIETLARLCVLIASESLGEERADCCSPTAANIKSLHWEYELQSDCCELTPPACSVTACRGKYLSQESLQGIEDWRLECRKKHLACVQICMKVNSDVMHCTRYSGTELLNHSHFSKSATTC